MMLFIEKSLKGLGRDFFRLVLLLAMAAFLFWISSDLPKATNEAAMAPLLTSSAMVIALAALSHFTRRVLFPRLDLQNIADKATEHPIGAAIVFFGVALVLSVLLYANVGMLR